MNDTTQHVTHAREEWTKSRKWLVSGLVLFHLFAVFASPAASPPPSSYAWSWLAGRVDGKDGLITPYLRAGYLNHGYRFFAPNPGPSHLIRYEIDLPSGDVAKGRFPDPNQQWPRLLYHRMFMISETAFNLSSAVSAPVLPNQPAPPLLQLEPPPGLSEPERIEFAKQRATALELAKGIARRLMAKHGAEHVRLYVQTHEIPFPTDVLAGQKLDAPELFHERLLGEFTEEQL